MTEQKHTSLEELKEKLEAIGGGADVCSIEDATTGLISAYENLISATVYIMERVTGKAS
jgi:hypothetical protein